MLTKVFESVLKMNLYGTAAAAIIIIIKLVVGRRLPIRFHKSLWIILVIKLLLPYGIPSPFSLNHYVSYMLSANDFFESSAQNIQYSNQHSNQALSELSNVNIQQNAGYISSQIGGEGNQPAAAPRQNNGIYVPGPDKPVSAQKLATAADWMTIAAYIWLCGVLALLLTFTMAYRKTARIFRSSAKLTNNENLHLASRLLEECRQELSCKRAIELILTNCFSFPFVFGFLRPAVVLPEGLFRMLSEDQLKSVLLHEITHIRKHDPLLRCLTAVLQAVYWFNPVMWAAFSGMAKDCERACDEAVIRNFDEQRCAQYASTLYRLAEVYSGKNMVPMLAFGENNIKTRIKDILKRRKYSLVSIVVAILILAVAGASMLTREVEKAQQTSFEVYVLEREHVGFDKSGDNEASRKLLFTHADILCYDWEKQILRIRNNGNFSYDLLKKDIEFVVNGEGIYTATFWSPIFSMVPPEIPVYNQSLLFDVTKDDIFLLIGGFYPEPDAVPDSILEKVMDERIYNALAQLEIPLTADRETIAAIAVWSSPEAADEAQDNKDMTGDKETSTPADKPEEALYARVKYLISQAIDSLSASSNPYDNLNGNEYFEELVSLGKPAIQIMFDMFAEHHEDGLKEYIMAAACAKILGVYDEERGTGIDSGTEWFMKYGRFSLDNMHFVDADYYDFQNTGSVKEGIMLPERTDKKDLEQVLSDYILARNRNTFYMGEKAFEAHHILRMDKTGDAIKVYMVARFAWFEFQNGIFTVVSGIGGIPVRMDLTKSQEGQYEVISYKEPMDGGMWRTSLQQMFPDDLIELVTQRDKMLQWEAEQVNNITEQARRYLNSIGREDAPVEYRYIPERADEGLGRAIYLVTGMRKGFPDWIGSREALVSTGGPYPGKQIRCIMETGISKTAEDEYLITLTRSWDTVINETKPLSVWKYKVAGNSVSLIEEQNMDDLIFMIK